MLNVPEDYLKLPYSRILIPDEGSYAAEILEFPGCFAQGETPNEAMANLEKAALSWIQVALSQEQEIPAPNLNQGYAGKIALRLPRSLHRQATRLAEHDGVSLNTFLVSAISARIGAEDFSTNLAANIERRLFIMEQKISALKLNAVHTGTGVNNTSYIPGYVANNKSPERYHA